MTKYLALFFFLLNMAFGEEPKTIAIITKKTQMNAWDPDSIKTGVPGSEEAVIYMSQQLAELGYKVFVFGNAPENSPYSAENANPRYLSTLPEQGTHFDIAISWRMPEIAAALKNLATKVYLWPHDILEPFRRLTPSQVTGFDDVLWLSEWQRQQWSAVYPAFAKYKNIYGNGISPEQFQPLKERKNPYSCIYGSNYARGLEILLEIWPEVKKSYPRATLDIYYGWQHWGQLAPEKETKMRQQIANLASLDVKEHGCVSHEELNRAFERASFWTYPCIMPETFCITALRAQVAGCIPVINEGSALVETVKGGYKCQNPNEYLSLLKSAMEGAEKITLDERKQTHDFILNRFTWENLAKEWKKQFETENKAAETKKMKPAIAKLKNAYFRHIDCHSATPAIERNEAGYSITYPMDEKIYIVDYDPDFKRLAQREAASPKTAPCRVPEDFQWAAGPLALDDGYLILVKENDPEIGYDVHRFLSLDQNHQIKQLSPPFTFRHQGTECCQSMIIDHSDKNIILPLSLENNKVQLCFVNLDTIRGMLKKKTITQEKKKYES